MRDAVQAVKHAGKTAKEGLVESYIHLGSKIGVLLELSCETDFAAKSKDFKELARRGKLAHGYIFFGEPEVGKFYFAKHLANFLETGEFSISSRPLQDLMVIDSTKNLKTDAIGILPAFFC